MLLKSSKLYCADLFNTKCGNGTACFKNVNNFWDTNISFYLETSGGQNFSLYLNVVHFFNTSVH